MSTLSCCVDIAARLRTFNLIACAALCATGYHRVMVHKTVFYTFGELLTLFGDHLNVNAVKYE